MNGIDATKSPSKVQIAKIRLFIEIIVMLQQNEM
jgi:hypothetical protein